MNENKGVASEFKVEGSTGTYLKGVDFDGNGLTLTVVGMEKSVASSPEYGVKHVYGAGGVVTKENWFVKEGILNEGETFRYKFMQGDVEKTFDNHSVGFYFAFTKVNPSVGDEVSIKRDKKSNTEVSWTIKVIKD